MPGILMLNSLAAKRILELRNAHGKTKQPLNQAKMNASEFNCDCVRISTKNVPNRDALAASLQRNPWDGGSYKTEIWPGLPVQIVQRRQASSLSHLHNVFKVPN